ncbi:hypothetical protein [Aquincola tertiaricarbonis]|uniref:hypothetical protein n=1 Tax=Aquincola tertiaricarbonis TaxID=391953 RepID=UPI000697DB00|nr:hypothetical protein [Aquincola tertiaricarbonis]
MPTGVSSRLAALALADLQAAGVQMRLGHTVTALHRSADGLALQVQGPQPQDVQAVAARRVFNCTYSGLNHIGGDHPGALTQLKHELTEMALVEVPPALRQVGVTVMDGPFFSCMAFPSQRLHTLSHVRYTPHAHWNDTPAVNPYRRLAGYERDSRFDRMLRDSSRYLPALAGAQYRQSLFEVKTILCKNEGDDGRPILFERSAVARAAAAGLAGRGGAAAAAHPGRHAAGGRSLPPRRVFRGHGGPGATGARRRRCGRRAAADHPRRLRLPARDAGACAVAGGAWHAPALPHGRIDVLVHALHLRISPRAR